MHNTAGALTSPSRSFQSTVKKKMATGTFTYNALHIKTLKECIKTHRKIVLKSLKLDKSNAIVGTTASDMPNGLSLVRKILW